MVRASSSHCRVTDLILVRALRAGDRVTQPQGKKDLGPREALEAAKESSPLGLRRCCLAGF